MRVRALFATLATALLLCGPLSAETPPIAPETPLGDSHTQVSVLMELGIAYAESNRYPLAIDRFQQVLALDPQFAPAHYSLGRVYAMQQRYEEAERELLSATRLAPGYADAFALLSFVSEALGDRRGALTSVEKAVAILKGRQAQPGEAGRAAVPSPETEPTLLQRLERRLEKLKRAGVDKTP